MMEVEEKQKVEQHPEATRDYKKSNQEKDVKSKDTSPRRSPITNLCTLKRMLIATIVAVILVAVVTVLSLVLPPDSTPSPPAISPPSKSEDNPATDEELANIMMAAGKVNTLIDDAEEVASTTNKTINDYCYIYETHNIMDNIQNIAYLGLNDDVIWSGALMEGKEVHNFIYTPSWLTHGPITLLVSLETSDFPGNITIDVTDSSLSTVRQGISDLSCLAIGDLTHVPACVEFNYQQVYSKSHMDLFVHAGLSYAAHIFSTAFDWSKDSAKYMQVYFTLDMDTLSSIADFFIPGITTTQVRLAVPADSHPVYVSRVSYGILAVMMIESSQTVEEMELAIGYSYEGMANIEVETRLTAQDIMEKSSISIIFYDGLAAGLKDLESNFNGFMKVVKKASSEFTPNCPECP